MGCWSVGLLGGGGGSGTLHAHWQDAPSWFEYWELNEASGQDCGACKTVAMGHPALCLGARDARERCDAGLIPPIGVSRSVYQSTPVHQPNHLRIQLPRYPTVNSLCIAA